MSVSDITLFTELTTYVFFISRNLEQSEVKWHNQTVDVSDIYDRVLLQRNAVHAKLKREGEEGGNSIPPKNKKQKQQQKNNKNPTTKQINQQQ